MTNDFDLLMISTCCNDQYIYKLIDSVIDSNKYVSVCLIIVNQTELNLIFDDSSNKSKIIVLNHGKSENTSVARNIGINYVLNKNLKSSFVSFPDDDSSFDFNFFQSIKSLIENDFSSNVITDIYCTEDINVLFRKVNLKNNSLLDRRNYNIVGAVNMLLNFKTFIKVGFFDDRFGVNALFGAGEDGDYFIRALFFERFYYKNDIYSFHPSGEGKFDNLAYKYKRKKLINYGKGVIAFLCKHKMYKEAFFVTMRGLGGTVVYIYKLKFTLALAYFEAFFVRLYCLIKFILQNNLNVNNN